MGKNKKNTSIFVKGYLIYILVLVLALCGLWLYVRGVMLDYETNTPTAYAAEQIKNAVNENNELKQFLDKYCFTSDLADKKAYESIFKNMAAGQFRFEKNNAISSADTTAFNVYSDERPFMTIGIKQGEVTTKLGMLSMVDWSVDYAIIRNAETGFENEICLKDGNLLSYKINIPEGFKLTVNGSEYTAAPKDQQMITDFKEFADFTTVPAMNVYEFSDIAFEPEFSAINNAGDPVMLSAVGPCELEAEAEYAESPEAEIIINSIADPIEIAKTWSMFMTDDVKGSKHGLNTVIESCKILEGTNLYSLAKNWASNVDILFVSGHTIKNWSGENVSRYIKYNDYLVSCDVYIEKNMTLKTGAPRTDVFSNRMFFAKVDGSWYLVDLPSVKAE